jgi:hypothetical protein
LRLNLAGEHHNREGPMDGLHDPAHMFTAFADCAAQLQRWYDGGYAAQDLRGDFDPSATAR